MRDISHLDNGLIFTDSEKCIGCNNCIRKCPTLESNVGVLGDDGVCKMHLDSAECILCGTCLDTCTHDARSFRDDYDMFMHDLRKGKQISVLIAPALLINYADEYQYILGYLKSLGVNSFYSVSFGADITTWAYLKYITENNALGKFSQPCPAIVSYAERHLPELLDEIMPVQSPMMCAAIYLKKYKGVTDDLMFLSPCIAKKIEMDSSRGLGMYKYNVTFINLMNSIRENGINLRTFEPVNDTIDYGLGSLYPVPGGLRENVEFYLGDDAMVAQAEGEIHAYEQMDLYKKLREEWNRHEMLPTLVDILNCGRGCNYGTATEFRHSDNGAIQVAIHKIRRDRRKKVRESAGNIDTGHNPQMNLDALNERHSDLNLNDFLCSYEDKTVKKPLLSSNQINNAYAEMRKSSEAEKRFDCTACGYKTCSDMAKAMTLGINVKENCAEYVKFLAQEQMSYQRTVISHFGEVSDLITQLNGDNVRISDDTSTINSRVEAAVDHGVKMGETLNDLQKEFEKIIKSYQQISDVARTTNILSINASIEAAHAGQMGRGFGVIAEEMGNLAQKVLAVAGQNESDSNSISGVLLELVDSINTFNVMIDEIKGSTGEIKSNVSNITGGTANIMELVQHLENMAETGKVQELTMKQVWDATTSEHLDTSSLRNAPGERKAYKSGEVIVNEGDSDADTMYLVLDGTVNVVKNRGTQESKTVATLKAGDLFGEMALFLNEPRTACVIASGQVTVIEIHRDILMQFMENSPEIANAIIGTLCKRLKNILVSVASI